MITPTTRERISQMLDEALERGETGLRIEMTYGEESAIRSSSLPVVIGRWHGAQVRVEPCPTCGAKNRIHGSSGPKAHSCGRKDGASCVIQHGYWVHIPGESPRVPE